MKVHRQRQILNNIKIGENEYQQNLLEEQKKTTDTKIKYERLHNRYYKAVNELYKILQQEKEDEANQEYNEMIPPEIDDINCVDYDNLIEQKIAFEKKKLEEQTKRLEEEKLRLIQARREEEERYQRKKV